MLRKGKRSGISIVGVDPGVTGLRAVQIRWIDGVAEVVNSARWETTQGDGETLPWAALPGFLNHAGFQGRRTAAVLHPPDLDYFALDLPADSDTDAEASIRAEVERMAGNRREDLETRYWRLPVSRSSAPGAIAVAASRTTVLEIVETLGRAGWLALRVDASAESLARVGALLRAWRKDELWGILDLGHRQARLVICLGETPVLVRTAGAGGGEWTDRIAQSLQVSERAADIHKREYGIRGAHAEESAGQTPVATAELAGMLLNILRGELRELATEIKRSFEYILSCYPGTSPSELLMVGGGAGMPGLGEHLAGALGIPVQRASSCLEESGCRLRYSTGKRCGLEELAVAVGTAIEE